MSFNFPQLFDLPFIQGYNTQAKLENGVAVLVVYLEYSINADDMEAIQNIIGPETKFKTIVTGEIIAS
jgi:hypothetical protein